jgi:hypothetical protein
MSTAVITADNLSKRYQRGMAATSGLLRDTLALANREPHKLFRRDRKESWLLWFARSSGALVVDASSTVCAVHQNHDYGYHPQGEKGVWQGDEAQENYKLLEGHRNFRTLENATHLLRAHGLHPNYRHWLVQGKRSSYDLFSPAWFRVLDLTRPLRHRMGLRQKGGNSL